MNIRDTIRTELENRGWTQTELARRSGMLQHRVSDYLNGHRDIYLQTAERIFEALELEITPRRRRRRKGQ